MYFGVNLVCMTIKRGAVLYQEAAIKPRNPELAPFPLVPL